MGKKTLIVMIVLGLEMNRIVIIDKGTCTGCGACVEICPNKILYLDDEKCKVTDETRCDRSKGCEYVCPTGAIKIQNKN